MTVKTPCSAKYILIFSPIPPPIKS
jgi:hypothetical protein